MQASTSPSNPDGHRGRILRLWAPLEAAWLLMAMEGPFLAAILARLPNPTYNLAAFGVAFGFGMHRCLGAPLARMELRIAWPALFRRFEHLTLAEDFEDVQFRSFHFIYGLRSLAVSWE